MVESGTHPKDATAWILSRSNTGLFTIGGRVGHKLVCTCACGSIRLKHRCEIARGDTVSCGCWHRVCSSWVGKRQTKHGLEKTRSYSTWSSMMARCYDSTRYPYSRYGGRGIKVCKRWHDITNFVADMGQRPKGHSIDRIDNNGDYEPGNCRWVTQRQQMNNFSGNRLVKLNGETLTVSQLAGRSGKNYHSIYGRLVRGWTPFEAATLPRYTNIKYARKHPGDTAICA